MPTILRVEGFRFFFFAKDCEEPIHVHVARGSGLAKIWVENGTIAKSAGFRQHEKNRIIKILEENKDYIIACWQQFCGE